MNKPTIIDAIVSLAPTAQVCVSGKEVEWHEPPIAPITEDAISAELTRLQAEYDAKEYQRQRAAAYPSIADQLDALWKGGDAAAEMLARVQAVKATYPKE